MAELFTTELLMMASAVLVVLLVLVGLRSTLRQLHTHVASGWGEDETG